jgi:hypothetical protein
MEKIIFSSNIWTKLYALTDGQHNDIPKTDAEVPTSMAAGTNRRMA